MRFCLKRTCLTLSLLLGTLSACDESLIDPQSADVSFDAVADLGVRFSHADSLAGAVVDAPGAGQGLYSDPILATNGVYGGGEEAGSTDVYSLGFLPGENDYLVLGFDGRWAENGQGVDFVVFENAFRVRNGDGYFIDPVIVALSQDGMQWIDFPHDYVAPDETVYSNEPADWPGFAGVSPVLLNESDPASDPFDVDTAGGDQFNLDDLPNDGALGSAIREGGFRYIRLTTAATQTNPDSGEPYPHDPVSNGPDIDGVHARYLVEH
ncbi:MAG: LIC_13355 family lipoprotein [Myxococcales bacterium]|nr:LIC_13355 family lipoprotein [Myxococcales bacterium]